MSTPSDHAASISPGPAARTPARSAASGPAASPSPRSAVGPTPRPAEHPAPRTGPRAAPRADARRNKDAVVDAALRLFRTDPSATVAQVASAAGIGRVTLYGHYPTRAALVGAALAEAVARAERAMAAAELADDVPAPEALRALLAATWPALADGHGAVEAACRDLPADEVAALHEPVVQPLRVLLAAGAAAGEVRADLGVDWLVAAVSALVHAAAEQVAAGAATHDAATAALTASVTAVVLPVR